MTYALSRRVVVEALGTAMLVAAVVGSGIMGERLASGNTAIALLANTFATSAMLVVIILAFGQISGAHFNPVVTLVMAARRSLVWRDASWYIVAQLVGAVLGTGLAHVMFGETVLQFSTHERSGMAQIVSEVVATFGLLIVILNCRAEAIPYAVAAYIGSAYWFTASTSFANPAVTVARTLTDTFSGIRPLDAPGFIMAQLFGAALAALFQSFMKTNR